MISRNAFARMLLLALAAALAACVQTPPIPDMRGAYSTSGDASVTVPFVLDDNRMFLDVVFVAPDGSPRPARAFVNMGSGAFVLSNKLYRELGADKTAVRMRAGAMTIAVDPRAVQPEAQANAIEVYITPFHKPKNSAELAKGPGGMMASLSAPMNVEAIIPPGLLAQFETVFDYGGRTLTLAQPGTIAPQGIAVPMRVDPRSGFVTLDVTAGGKTYPTVLDNGGSYSGFRADLVEDWISEHPAWLRSEGTVGESNYIMVAGADTDSPVLKIQGASIGPLRLEELGASSVGAGGLLGRVVNGLFWDWYSDKAGGRVNGWIAGNVLKSYRVTLDYRAGTSYWLQQMPLDAHDLDQVGVTLARVGTVTTVAGIARKNGAPTVSAVLPGDELLQIDGRPTAAMTRGELLSALRGMPGQHKRLTLKRKDRQIEVDTVVTAF